MKFFVNTGDWVEIVDTQEKAIELAQKAIEEYRDNASDGWAEEVEDVCWGPVYGQAVRHDSEDRLHCDFELLDPENAWQCNLCGAFSHDALKTNPQSPVA